MVTDPVVLKKILSSSPSISIFGFGSNDLGISRDFLTFGRAQAWGQFRCNGTVPPKKDTDPLGWFCSKTAFRQREAALGKGDSGGPVTLFDPVLKRHYLLGLNTSARHRYEGGNVKSLGTSFYTTLDLTTATHSANWVESVLREWELWDSAEVLHREASQTLFSHLEKASKSCAIQ